MPAPKGNKNGIATWYKPISNEATVTIGVRVTSSQAELIDAQLEPGQSRSEWLRLAIEEKLSKEQN